MKLESTGQGVMWKLGTPRVDIRPDEIMSSRNTTRLPLPIGGVTEMYITDLVNALDFFITQTTNPVKEETQN